MTNSQLQRYWAKNERYKAKYVRKYRKEFREVLNAQIQPVLAYINVAPNPEAVIEAIPSLMQSDGLTAVFNQLYIEVGVDYADRYYNQIQKANEKANKNDGLTNFQYVWTAAMAEYANGEAGIYITSIIGTSQATAIKLVQSVVIESLDRGLSIEQTMTRLEDKIQPAWRNTAIWRSELIARTEVLTASNYGAQTGATSIAEELDLKLNKRWLAIIDNRTREPHIDANGQTVGLKEKFEVGGSSMNQPGDPRGGADNRCNCRCTVVYERADGEPMFSA